MVWGRGWMARRADQSARSTPEVATEGIKSEGMQTNAGGQGAVAAGKARVHYFTKDALTACSTETVAFEQDIDAKYGHQGAGALVAMTLPLPAGTPDTYVSALPSGTRLLTMRIDRDGVAHADYNGNLNNAVEGCAKAERRAQIESTLREFPEIKSVVITVEGKVWE